MGEQFSTRTIHSTGRSGAFLLMCATLVLRRVASAAWQGKWSVRAATGNDAVHQFDDNVIIGAGEKVGLVAPVMCGF